MSSIFKNQGYFVLILDTGISLAAATVTKIKYRKPSGTTGAFTATVTETTKLQYQFANDDLDEVGKWEFQAYVEFTGLQAYGEIVEQEIRTPIVVDES